MDPTATLLEVLAALKVLDEQREHVFPCEALDRGHECEVCELRIDVIDSLKHLAEWLDKGGFPPAVETPDEDRPACFCDDTRGAPHPWRPRLGCPKRPA